MSRRSWKVVLSLLAAALLVLAGQLRQPTPTSPARVLDGDTLEMNGTRYRLFGVDAPEHDQQCTDARGASWACGEAAATRLRELVAGHEVRCTTRDHDPYGRTVATCAAAGQDLGGTLVQAGLALAYRRYSPDYIDEEDSARVARRGMWGGRFTPPWEHREAQRRERAP